MAETTGYLPSESQKNLGKNDWFVTIKYLFINFALLDE
jgi:hypothetical protein